MMRCGFASRSFTFWRSFPSLYTTSQRLHQVDNLGWFAFAWRLDLLAVLFFLQQLFQRILVLVLEFLGIEISFLGVNDMRRQLKHVGRHLLVFNVVEIVPL